MADDNASKNRPQFAVYWAKSGTNEFGEPTVAAPVEINVRIEKGKQEIVDSDANTVAYDHLVNVDTELVIGSLIWFGKLADVPSPQTDLLQVIDYEEIPNVKCTKFDRWVKLMKHSDKVPELT